MHRAIRTAAVALLGLTFGVGADADTEGKNVFLVYSTDERSELHPCG